jgi:1-acyl-sn-glycerol-3-phosphate acyltransferase
VAAIEQQKRWRLPRLRDVNHEPVEPFYRRFVTVIGLVLRFVGDRDWRRTDKVPKVGGVLVVANHTSYFDPLAVGMYLIWGAGRWPRYLGKVQLFHAPVIGWLARSCGQIPVERHSAKAKDALAAAEAALAAGKCVAIYPEGTLTGDPTMWPMKGKTGAARLVLETDVPVIPVGQWGAHFFLPDEKPGFPLVLSRSHVFRVSAGDPVDLADLRGRPVTKELLDEATGRIIDAITAQVALLRGEPVPTVRWDPAIKGYVPVAHGSVG